MDKKNRQNKKKDYKTIFIIGLISMIVVIAVSVGIKWAWGSTHDDGYGWQAKQTEGSISFKIPANSGEPTRSNTPNSRDTEVQLPNNYDLVIREFSSDNQAAIEQFNAQGKATRLGKTESVNGQSYYIVGLAGSNADSYERLYLSKCEDEQCNSVINLDEAKRATVYIWKNLSREKSYTCCGNPLGYIGSQSSDLPVLLLVLESLKL